MSDFISECVVTEILKRLPVEDAVRCTSVCKSWYSLITTPNFISLHSNHMASSSSSNKGLVLLRDSINPNEELYSLHLDDETFEIYKHLDFPVASVDKGSIFSVVGCVNGVVCLSDDTRTYSDIIHLWNPSIRKYLTLPYPIFGYCTHRSFMHSVGFGFDASTNDFKVVRVVYLYAEESMVPPKVEIYEPNVGSWREADAKGFSHIIDERSPQVFLHGNVHWVIGCKDEHDFFKELNGTNLIVSFDLRTEEFGMMNVPDSLNEPQRKQDFCVTVLGDSLSLIHYNGNTSCIWVMKQYGVPYSWTKLFSIDVVGRFWWVFGFRTNGEALVKVSSPYRDRKNLFSPCWTHENLLVSFEPKSRQGKLLTEFGNWKPLYVVTFVESLALLLVKGKCADTISSDEDSSDLDDECRCLEPAAIPRSPNILPLGQVVVSWFG